MQIIKNEPQKLESIAEVEFEKSSVKNKKKRRSVTSIKMPRKFSMKVFGIQGKTLRDLDSRDTPLKSNESATQNKHDQKNKEACMRQLV